MINHLIALFVNLLASAALLLSLVHFYQEILAFITLTPSTVNDRLDVPRRLLPLSIFPFLPAIRSTSSIRTSVSDCFPHIVAFPALDLKREWSLLPHGISSSLKGHVRRAVAAFSPNSLQIPRLTCSSECTFSTLSVGSLSLIYSLKKGFVLLTFLMTVGS